MSDTRLAIGKKHNHYCEEDATANIQTAILSYHDGEIEVTVYVYCDDCDRLVGQTTATVTLIIDEQKTSS